MNKQALNNKNNNNKLTKTKWIFHWPRTLKRRLKFLFLFLLICICAREEGVCSARINHSRNVNMKSRKGKCGTTKIKEGNNKNQQKLPLTSRLLLRQHKCVIAKEWRVNNSNNNNKLRTVTATALRPQVTYVHNNVCELWHNNNKTSHNSNENKSDCN